MDRPAPVDHQPPLRLASHLWRVLLMLLLSGAGWIPIVQDEARHDWWLAADLVLGLASYVLVFYRRRWPVQVALTLALVSMVSGIAAGPSTLALASLATRRRWREIVVVGSVAFAAGQLFSTWVDSSSDTSPWVDLIVNAIATSAVIAWGMYVGSRRELIWTLRNRAERAEAEQELRVGQARSQERARIAREMHDVLAHRISQISMHAGALAFREDLIAEEMRASAAVIRDRSHEALTDLRDVLGVLRDETGERRSAPQPTYADLADLVAEARGSGMRVEFEDLLTGAAVPDAVGRAVYRIVQEGMTNARKHAPGTLLTVRIEGTPETGVDLLLSNPIGFGPTQTPGAGLGLIGLSERAELRGGRMTAGLEGSAFVVRGWIPWTS